MKIAVVGMGYVGLANGVMLAQKNKVTILDICSKKVAMLNSGISPIKDSLITSYLAADNLNISATSEPEIAYKNAKYILICIPTNYSTKMKSFDTSSIDEVIRKLDKLKFSGLIVIRSTVPIGFTGSLQKKYPHLKFSFFPEFLREGSALEDNLKPSRLICGSSSNSAKKFLQLLLESANKKNIPTLITESDEAEAIKLFSNAYLAMRVSFFNELDTFAFENTLAAKDIISGVSMDPRIGNFYNNPSFGYGGYCLPKDTMQLKNQYKSLPQEIISSTIKSNKKRKLFISNFIKNHPAKKIGIYRLSMKKNSDNWRGTAILDVAKSLKKCEKKLHIYEPMIKAETIMGINVVNDLDEFINESDLILANRLDSRIKFFKEKILTRDIFHTD